MPYAVVLIFLLGSTPGLSQPPPVAAPLFDAQGRALGAPLSERVVSYEIEARLDPASRTLVGKETLTWRNRGAEPQGTLWFHLYWNAFKDGRSTFYRDARRMGGIRHEDVSSPNYPEREEDDWGYSEVKAVAVQGGADLLPTLRFQHPDDDNADDRTVFTVTLPEPVPPGGSVTLDLRWEARVPKLISRAGHMKGFYLFGQWFPKIGVLEVPPERGAVRPRWNCHQHHSSGEFYADFGTYDVRVTVPRAMKVGATGVLVERRDNPDGTTTSRFHQDDVHDFAWTAWDGFEVAEDIFREPGMPEVRLTLLFDPRQHRSRAQLLEATKASLKRYGEWWFPFPYPHLTVVAPPPVALDAGGMEYPTFITAISRRDPAEPRDFALWELVAHELGHNYWYGMVASNETEEAWLDEGFTNYGTSRLRQAEGVLLQPEKMLPASLRWALGDLFALPWTNRDRLRTTQRPLWSSPATLPSWSYRTMQDYRFNAYSRPEAALFALESLVGEETMGRILRTYATRWRFRHPRAEDFFAVASEVTGQDLSWFWDAALLGTGGLDYAVSRLDCAESNTPPAHRCDVEVERRGEARVPVEMKVTFEDGSQRVERWDGAGRWQRWTYERSEAEGGPVRQVELSSRGALALDASPADNTRTRATGGHVTPALLGWLTYVHQALFSFTSAVF